MKRPVGMALMMMAVGTVLVTGCGDDDTTTELDTTATQAAPATTQAGPATTLAAAGTTQAAAGDATQFCDAVLAGDQLFSSGGPPDPAAWDAIVADLLASTPDAVAAETAYVVEQTTAMVQGRAEDSGPSAEYGESLNAVHAWMASNCGWPSLEVDATEYAFSGIPAETEAGKSILVLNNNGAEVHEMAVMRINDGVTESVEELLQLPEEEVMAKISPIGGPFATPDTPGYSAVELTPGRYAVVCFIPRGTTVENMEAIETGQSQGGEPHAVLGMHDEFMVS